MFGGHGLGAAQPFIDFLIRGGEQGFELVQAGVVQPRQRGIGIAPEDQINLLEAAPLGPEQKHFTAVLRRATLLHVIHAADIAVPPVENNGSGP